MYGWARFRRFGMAVIWRLTATQIVRGRFELRSKTGYSVPVMRQ